MVISPYNLKIALDNSELTASEICKQIGINKSAFSHYLSGKCSPKADKLKQIADILKVSEDYLLGLEDPNDYSFEYYGKISVKEAARCMGASENLVRVGLQRGLLDFGFTIKIGKTYRYYINPLQLKRYVGEKRFSEFFGTPKEKREHIGTRIKARRKKLCLSAEEIALHMGVSPSTIYRYEDGDIVHMGVDKLEKLAVILNTTPMYLMGWETVIAPNNPDDIEVV